MGASRAECMQSPYAYVAPSHQVEAGGEKAHRLLGRGRKLLHKLDICAIKARIARERLLLEKPFGHMPWSPRPATYNPPHKLAEARGEKPQEIHHRATKDVARAPELKRRLCRRLQNAKGLETRRLGEGPAAGGAARSGGSTTSAEPSCSPRCLTRRSFRRRRGKAAEAGAFHTPQSPTGRAT